MGKPAVNEMNHRERKGINGRKCFLGRNRGRNLAYLFVKRNYSGYTLYTIIPKEAARDMSRDENETIDLAIARQEAGDEQGSSARPVRNRELKAWHAPRCRPLSLGSTEGVGTRYSDGAFTKQNAS
jgi:hypothetical protein